MSGVIYKITVGNEVYVGSTINFKQRRKRHKYNIYHENSNSYHQKLYKTIRENDGEWEMTIYEDNLSVTKDELRIREEEVRLLLGATLNNLRAYSSKEDKREYHCNYNRGYNCQLTKCECGVTVTKGEIARHRRTKKHITLMTLQA